MRDELLSSVGPQWMDTCGFQVFDLDKVGLHWEKDQMDVDAVVRPGKEKPFSPSTSKFLRRLKA